MKTELTQDGLIRNEEVQDFTEENAELLIPYFTSVLDYLETEAQLKDNIELETFYGDLKQIETDVENSKRNEDYTFDKEQEISKNVLDLVREESTKEQPDVTTARLEDGFNTIINRVDQLLYESRENGSNRITQG